MEPVRAFADLRAADRPQVGGKCASLGELLHAGIEVPDGFAVGVDAFEAFRDTDGLRERLLEIVRTAGSDVGAIARASERATALVEATPIPEAVAGAVRDAYADLCHRTCERRGLAPTDLPVAVRSSAVAEDGAEASFAGQQETFLWVVGADDVLAHLRRCWASLYTPQAIAYRNTLSADQDHQATLLAVGVQLMVDAEAAGVMFTASPRTGDRSVMAINASWGLGEAVVAGEVTPDEYWVDRVSGTLRDHSVADKAVARRPSQHGTGVVVVQVDETQRRVRCVDDATLQQLIELGTRIEAHYGAPQDIEWALERDATGTARVVALQSRPETVFANRRTQADNDTRRATAGYMDIIQSMARTAGPADGTRQEQA